MYLDEEELIIAGFRIHKTDPGKYKIGQIYDDLWADTPDHNALGRRFKASVKAGHLDDISHEGTPKDNNERYRVKLPII